MSIMLAQPPLVAGSETKSTNILGPTYFELCDLRIEASTAQPAPPMQIAPANSPYIVAEDEMFSVSVDVKFNNTPLTRLLLCLGMKVEVHFAFEGIGGKAGETDASEYIVTEKNDFEYTVTWEGHGPSNWTWARASTALPPSPASAPLTTPAPRKCWATAILPPALLQVYPA
jgi:hypothetical protein